MCVSTVISDRAYQRPWKVLPNHYISTCGYEAQVGLKNTSIYTSGVSICPVRMQPITLNTYKQLPVATNSTVISKGCNIDLMAQGRVCYTTVFCLTSIEKRTSEGSHRNSLASRLPCKIPDYLTIGTELETIDRTDGSIRRSVQQQGITGTYKHKYTRKVEADR